MSPALEGEFFTTGPLAKSPALVKGFGSFSMEAVHLERKREKKESKKPKCVFTDVVRGRMLYCNFLSRAERGFTALYYLPGQALC